MASFEAEITSLIFFTMMNHLLLIRWQMVDKTKPCVSQDEDSCPQKVLCPERKGGNLSFFLLLFGENLSWLFVLFWFLMVFYRVLWFDCWLHRWKNASPRSRSPRMRIRSPKKPRPGDSFLFKVDSKDDQGAWNTRGWNIFMLSFVPRTRDRHSTQLEDSEAKVTFTGAKNVEKIDKYRRRGGEVSMSGSGDHWV